MGHFFAELPYRVIVFPSKKQGSVTTTANAWVAISGSLNETKQVSLPRNSLEFVFHVSIHSCLTNPLHGIQSSK